MTSNQCHYSNNYTAAADKTEMIKVYGDEKAHDQAQDRIHSVEETVMGKADNSGQKISLSDEADKDDAMQTWEQTQQSAGDITTLYAKDNAKKAYDVADIKANEAPDGAHHKQGSDISQAAKDKAGSDDDMAIEKNEETKQSVSEARQKAGEGKEKTGSVLQQAIATVAETDSIMLQEAFSG